jgi:adenylate cyclase
LGHDPRAVSDDTKRSRTRRTLARLMRLDEQPVLLAATRAARRRLPGDDRYGDPLSLAGDEPAQQLGRRLTAVTAQRPSALREVGLSALQVWQSLSEAQGRGHGDREVAILFTDLVDFSRWALEVGDERSIELLRRVGLAAEPLVSEHGGKVVKRLGDGLMAVFDDPCAAVDAAHAMGDAVGRLEVAGYRPRQRAGIHVGTPRRLGGDLFGVDVNIAARVAEAAGADEVLISDAVRQRLGDEESLRTRRRWRFRAKGAPRDLTVYVASREG